MRWAFQSVGENALVLIDTPQALYDTCLII
jgi:hypothetical protein